MEELLKITRENNRLLKDNNRMLREIIQVINAYLSNAAEENMNDFGRNVLANLVSSRIIGY